MKHHRSPHQTLLLLSVALVLGLALAVLIGGAPAQAAIPPADVDISPIAHLIPVADGSGNADIEPDVSCMEEEAGFGLVCTANDVSIANVTNITILDDGCAFPGDEVTFTADFEVLLTAQARYDVGIWFAQDGDPNGDGARTGSCTAATPAYAPDPPWLDLDGTDDPSGIQDTCGDIDDDHNPLFPSITLTVVCTDADANGKLDLPNCTSWRQPGDNDLCTSPSEAVPGAPSKCKCDPGFDIDIPVPGQIIVDKVTVPAGSEQSFDFALTGTPVGTAYPPVNVPFSLTDAAAPFESSNLYEGTYQVTETVPDGWELSASCTTDSATPNDATDDVTSDYANGADLPLASGEIIRCTFTNTENPKTGNIIIKKVTEPAGASTLFPFDPSWSAENFSLLDGGEQDSGSLAPGSYSVTELVPDDWQLTGLVCVDPDDGSAVDLDGATARIDLDADETVTCTFTNTENPKTGNIIIKKVTARPGASTLFPFNPSWSDANFSLLDGGMQDSGPLPVGGYTVTELVPAYWKLTGLVCIDPDSGTTVDLAGATATIDLDADETVTCTFTNTKYGRIVIIKEVSPKSKPWDPNTRFEFDASWLDQNFFLKNLEKFDTNYTLWPGNYTVRELVPAGWLLLGVSCNDPDRGSSGSIATATATIDLDTGETVTCKFLNTKK